MAGQGVGEGPLLVGIDLGGTKILAAVIAADNTIVGRAKVATPADQGAAAILQALLNAVDGALGEANLVRSAIAASS